MLAVQTVAEQRVRAVYEVLDGVPVTEVALRYGVRRQTVHRWLRAYAADGLGGLVDRSSRPASCPHQMSTEVEARVLALRLEHPGWGPSRILFHLEREGVDPLPGRSGVYRALVRHGLVDPAKRRKKRSDYRRWERDRAMALWQMDVMGRVYLADGSQVSIVTGIDDHSRFVVCAKVVVRAQAPAVCQALSEALSRHGVPEEILTDNGKVFTARFGSGPGPTKFDQICLNNGIRHLLTAPYSPTTTGKVERLHKTMRKEFFNLHDREYASVADLQAALDAWVDDYNTNRPHQSVGNRPPIERFIAAVGVPAAVEGSSEADDGSMPAIPVGLRPAGVGRWVNRAGTVSVAGKHYRVGAAWAGEHVEVVASPGLLQIFHHGVLIANHVVPETSTSPLRQGHAQRPQREPSTGLTVTRLADNNGAISFAGTMYKCGRAWAGSSIDVSIVAGSVQLAYDGKIIRVHPIRHDRAKEYGAFAQPHGHRQHHKHAA